MISVDVYLITTKQSHNVLNVDLQVKRIVEKYEEGSDFWIK